MAYGGKRMTAVLLKRGIRPARGFTLIELLVVIIIIAILAAIAIPSYMMYRSNAQDTAAVNLVRNGLTVVQTALAEVGHYAGVTEAMLEGIENNIDWIESLDDVVTVGGSIGISESTMAEAREGEIVFFVESANRIDLASRSESGNWFGMQIDTLDQVDTGYVKVKIIDGAVEEGW